MASVHEDPTELTPVVATRTADSGGHDAMNAPRLLPVIERSHEETPTSPTSIRNAETKAEPTMPVRVGRPSTRRATAPEPPCRPQSRARPRPVSAVPAALRRQALAEPADATIAGGLYAPPRPRLELVEIEHADDAPEDSGATRALEAVRADPVTDEALPALAEDSGATRALEPVHAEESHIAPVFVATHAEPWTEDSMPALDDSGESPAFDDSGATRALEPVHADDATRALEPVHAPGALDAEIAPALDAEVVAGTGEPATSFLAVARTRIRLSPLLGLGIALAVVAWLTVIVSWFIVLAS